MNIDVSEVDVVTEKPRAKRHTRGYYRRVRSSAIRRKRRKCTVRHIEWYPVKGKYSKGKIHCSCPMCSAKTNPNDKTYGYCASDKRKIAHLADSYSDLD